MSFLSYLTTLISKPSPLIPREDRLSALPDSILCHILSFLPTKHSVATSILSKRWKSLWFSVLAVNLVAKNLSDIETFDSMILLRDIKVPIQTLRLKCNVRVTGFRYDEQECIIQNFCDHINPLITGALQRGLETLELDMKLATSVQTSPLALHSNVFSCKTLTVLKLSHVSIVTEDLSQLNIKTLHLDHVYFISHTDIINFFSSFHALEELKTNDVLVEKYIPQTLMIKCLPNLIRAAISDSETIPLFLLSRALILSIKLRSTHLMDHYDVYRLTQIEVFFEFDSKKKWEWMLEMLQHSPKLQHLIINEKTENDEGEDNWEVPATVPECLSSQLKTCLIKDCGGRTCELQFAEYVMRNSKVLRTMTIHSSRSINLKAKFLVLQKLSLCPRSCKLIFD